MIVSDWMLSRKQQVASIVVTLKCGMPVGGGGKGRGRHTLSLQRYLDLMDGIDDSTPAL